MQGVWFRAWTSQQAEQLGLSGWVRNCSDGAVEAVFSGHDGQVDQMIKRCWEGPPMAEVEKVSEHPCDPPEPGFHHLPTA